MPNRLHLTTALVIALAAPAVAQEDGTHNLVAGDALRTQEMETYSPYAGRNFPTRPLWGDTHLHTSASLDAFGWGTG